MQEVRVLSEMKGNAEMFQVRKEFESLKQTLQIILCFIHLLEIVTVLISHKFEHRLFNLILYLYSVIFLKVLFIFKYLNRQIRQFIAITDQCMCSIKVVLIIGYIIETLTRSSLMKF